MSDLIAVAVVDLKAGPALDWAVAKAEGLNPIQHIGSAFPACWIPSPHHPNASRFSPSTDWSDGGPLIESHGMAFAKFYEPVDGPILPGHEWAAQTIDDKHRQDGPTPLVVAMRVIVAAKFGDAVTVPRELVEVAK